MSLEVSLADTCQGLGSVNPVGSRQCRLESGVALGIFPLATCAGTAPRVQVSLLTSNLVDKYSSHGDLHVPINIRSNG